MTNQLGVPSLLLLSAVVTPLAESFLFQFAGQDATNLIPEWVPSCFETDSLMLSQTPLDAFAACLGGYVTNSTCLENSGMDMFSVGMCVANATGVDIANLIIASPDPSVIEQVIKSLSNESRYCLDALVPCINSTIQDRIETVLEPTCLPDKLSNLSACAEENALACNASCSSAWAALDANPLNGTVGSTCDGIQSGIVDPFCPAVTCCEACVPHYEALMGCLVNEVFNYTNETCAFSCTSTRRQLRPSLLKDSTKTRVRSLEEADYSCLQFAAGAYTTEDPDPEVLGLSFLPCVTSQFAEEVAAAAAVSSGDGGAGNMTGNTTDGASLDPFMGVARDFDFWRGKIIQSLIPEWFPQCFELGDNVFDIVGIISCLANNTGVKCFNETSFETIVTCYATESSNTDFNISDASAADAIQVLEEFANATRTCLAPYADCVNATIQERIVSKLEPTCLPEKVNAVESCLDSNSILCKVACDAAWAEHVAHLETALEGLDATDLTTCSGIQTNLVVPACMVVTCCKPCVVAYEEMMDCVANEVLNVTDESCAFQCDGESTEDRRALRRSQPAVAHRSLEDVDSELMLFCLQYAPGLYGVDEEELANQAPQFIPCINAGILAVLDAANSSSANTTNNTGTKDNNTGTNTTPAGDSSFAITATPSLWTSLFLVAGSLWLCLLL